MEGKRPASATFLQFGLPGGWMNVCRLIANIWKSFATHLTIYYVHEKKGKKFTG